jgi:hypothetical protein
LGIRQQHEAGDARDEMNGFALAESAGRSCTTLRLS